MPNLNAIQVQALVREMDHSMRRHKGLKKTNLTEYRNKLVAENKTLYDDYPTIFEMHFEGKLDGTFFEMLKLRHAVEKGEMTEDQASVIVGQKLFDRFVKPAVDAAPPAEVEKPMSYSDYYKQFEKE